MKAKYTSIRHCTSRLISSSGLIIAGTVLSFALNSCGVPRSVGAGRVESRSKTPKIENMAGKTPASQSIEEYENLVLQAKNEKNKDVAKTNVQTVPESISETRLPSLQEQMQALSKEQSDMKFKITGMQSDISEIKESLEEIKNALRPIVGKQSNNVTAGENLVTPSKPVNTNDNIILPDELIENQKTQIKPSPKKQIKAKSSNTVTIKNSTANTSRETPVKMVSNIIENNDSKTVSDTPADMTAALNAFADKNYNAAISQMTQIMNEAKSAASKSECSYWIGESYFNLKDYPQAINYYSKVLKNGKSDRHDDAQAKLGESLLRTGQVNEAKSAFQNLIIRYPGSEYVPIARKMLQQL